MKDEVVLELAYRGFNPHERLTVQSWIMPNRRSAKGRVADLTLDPDIAVSWYKIYRLVEEK